MPDLFATIRSPIRVENRQRLLSRRTLSTDMDTAQLDSEPVIGMPSTELRSARKQRDDNPDSSDCPLQVLPRGLQTG